MIYLFWGQDDFSLGEAITEIRAGLGEPGLAQINTTALRGSVSARELGEACSAAPFFLPHRLIVVTGLLRRFDRRRDAATAETQAAEQVKPFWEVLEKIPESTILILVEERLEGSNPLIAALRKRAQVRDFPMSWGRERQRWIGERVARGGGKISPEAVRLLSDLAGDSLWHLSTEVEKLLLYASGGVIGSAEVRQVVSPGQEANIYRLSDALLQGRAAYAGKAFHQLLEHGFSPAGVFARLAGELRLIVQAQEMLSQGRPPKEIGEGLNVRHEYRLKQIIAQAQNRPLARLKEVYQRLLETDLALKSGRWGEEVAVDFLIAALCPS